MQPITVQYLLRLGVCWTRSKLGEASKAWPNSVTWSWFLGSRLATLERTDIMARVHVALAHVALHFIRLPMPPGQLAELCKAASAPQVLVVLEHLGALLDFGPEDFTGATPETFGVEPPGYRDAFDSLEAAIDAAKAGAP